MWRWDTLPDDLLLAELLLYYIGGVRSGDGMDHNLRVKFPPCIAAKVLKTGPGIEPAKYYSDSCAYCWHTMSHYPQLVPAQSTSTVVAAISATDVRNGTDIQGISWDTLAITRETYRNTRLQQYVNYENIPFSGKALKEDRKITRRGGVFYEFSHNYRSVRPSIFHFQLRNLVWATTSYDAYLMTNFSVVSHWSALTCSRSDFLDVSGHVAPTQEHPGNLSEGFKGTSVSTLAVKDKLLVVGGTRGELICKHLDRPGVSFCTKTAEGDLNLTNAVEIYDTPSAAVHFTISGNDCAVRDFDVEKYQLSKHLQFSWPVNHTSMSPDGKLLVVVGDKPDGLLVDSDTGKTVMALNGHLDHSFASAWNPDGVTFATGNQDKTCRIWDVRNLSKSIAVLQGNLGGIYCIRYTADGQYMAMAESADFVHIYDAKNGYEEEQEIDFFGEVGGISFSPDSQALYIGISDHKYGGLLVYGLCQSQNH
ncbi:hypothetical protein Tsubulata_001958 [Turnera subulata]|uniref:DUF2415 domain-containing protein n=1 Tax=Turnera subulata TaxID=218843 RepID=A0A9Q0J375_9ROSI|nr:hypothetical protein Tsubulata_001958 [Turnera subulata]